MIHIPGLPERPLDPPEPSGDVLLRQQEARTEAMDELLQGRGEFWNYTYDSIQEAVRKSLAENADAELLKVRVLAAIAVEGLRYANYVAREVE